MNAMRWLVFLLGTGICLWTAGCAKTRSGTGTSPAGRGITAPASATGEKPDNKVLVTPSSGLVGKVASVNSPGQFVVLTFEGGQMPGRDQKLSIYRNNLKVGEVKVSREQIGQNLVADITAGEVKVGDEARPD